MKDHKHNFRQLQIWQRSMNLCSLVYKSTAKFPDTEKFGLISQANRAVVSIPANISEGAGRNTNKDFQKYLSIALGSANELLTLIELSNDLQFIAQSEYELINKEIQEISSMIYKFTNSLN